MKDDKFVISVIVDCFQDKWNCFSCKDGKIYKLDQYSFEELNIVKGALVNIRSTFMTEINKRDVELKEQIESLTGQKGISNENKKG